MSDGIDTAMNAVEAAGFQATSNPRRGKAG